MSAVVEHPAAGLPDDSAEPPEHPHSYQEAHTRHYIIVAIVLAAITAMEVALTYIDVGPLFLPALLLLMGIKFVMVVLEFMHLRRDAKIFHYLFWSGFGLAVGVYIGTLATFHVFLQP
jgi:cytochrome c oxidase subunit 4